MAGGGQPVFPSSRQLTIEGTCEVVTDKPIKFPDPAWTAMISYDTSNGQKGTKIVELQIFDDLDVIIQTMRRQDHIINIIALVPGKLEYGDD